MKIGFIGSGKMGAVLARLWVKAGHEVILSSRHPDHLKLLAKTLGQNSKVTTPEEAARLGDVILLSIPLGEIEKLSKETLHAMKGKIVMDMCNPYPDRDGKAGNEALKDPQGSGVWVANKLPGVKVVKAFNSVYYKTLEMEAHRKMDPVGVPLASDDKHALDVVAKLVKDAGFGPVIVGPLAKAKEFDNGTPPYASDATVSELEKMLGLKKVSNLL